MPAAGEAFLPATAVDDAADVEALDSKRFRSVAPDHFLNGGGRLCATRRLEATFPRFPRLPPGIVDDPVAISASMESCGQKAAVGLGIALHKIRHGFNKRRMMPGGHLPFNQHHVGHAAHRPGRSCGRLHDDAVALLFSIRNQPRGPQARAVVPDSALLIRASARRCPCPDASGWRLPDQLKPVRGGDMAHFRVISDDRQLIADGGGNDEAVSGIGMLAIILPPPRHGDRAVG